MAKSEDKLKLTIDLGQLREILDAYHEGVMHFGEAAKRINYLYDGTARTYTLQMQDKSTKLQEEGLKATKAHAEQQHKDITELIKAIKGVK